MDNGEKCIVGRGNPCKGPEVGTCSVWLGERVRGSDREMRLERRRGLQCTELVRPRSRP